MFWEIILLHLVIIKMKSLILNCLSETGSSSMHELFSSINDASVDMQQPAVSNVCTDNHSHGQDKIALLIMN